MLALGLRRAAAEQDGFTLAEMLVVLAILGIVLAGLTVALHICDRRRADQTKRVDAQQDVRVALDQLRRELRCAALATTRRAATLASARAEHD